MRFLLTASCSDGLVLPAVPLAWALRAAGHEVLVGAAPNMGALVTGAGLPFAPYSQPVTIPDVLRHDREGNPLPMPQEEGEMLAHIGRGYGRLAARTLDDTLALVDGWKPDLVISEPQGLGGPLAAGARDLPWVRLGISMGSPPVLEESAMTEAKPEIDRLGLPGFPEAALTLDVCPPSVRRSDSAEATSLRYVPYNGVAVLPSWLLEPRDRPRVCLTLGTQVPLRGGLPMMAQLMATLTGLGLEVVVAVDDAVADQLEPRPEGVRAVGRLPLNLVLPHCDLVVHHCGSGTTMTSLTAGVPQLIIPVIAETWDFARRLAGFGSAREIKPADTDQATVVEACTALLDDPAPRAAAGVLRDEIAAMPSPAQTVPVLEELVRSGGGSR